MSGLDYVALGDGALPTSQFPNPVRSALGLLGVALSGLVVHLMSDLNKPPPSTDFIPKRGKQAVAVRPTPPGALQLLTLNAAGPKCLFSYEHRDEGDAFATGADTEKGYLYGVRFADGSPLIEATGNPVDFVKGKLLCWPKAQFLKKLHEADKYWRFTPTGNVQGGSSHRAVVLVVRRDGSAAKAFCYFRSPVMDHFDPKFPPRVVIFGGMGRVGQSTMRSLESLGYTNTKVVGRRKPNIISTSRGGYIPLGCEGTENFTIGDEARAAIRESDIVINIMGPFQARARAELLEAILTERRRAPRPLLKRFYIDLSDDYSYGAKVTALSKQCAELNVTAVTNGGLSPGVSNLLVADELERRPQQHPNIRLHYFTAGTGNLGPTILTTSFLLLGSDCHIIDNEKETTVPSCSEIINKNFTKIGKNNVVLLDLPDATSLGKFYHANSSRGYFGTRPEIWNKLHVSIGRNFPKKWLKSRDFCEKFAKVSYFPTRIVDKFVGSALAMKLEVGPSTIDFYHPDFLTSAGIGAALMTTAMWEQGNRFPTFGAFFPEEFYDATTRQRIFRRAQKMGCVIQRPL
eukprot:gb/GEZN01003538.1/.p1 GENE.gb/GEZN01003538.1/~~gb/GEZN01003538.1/.p1  ORF type:complete len:574 (-),score=83.32 gb/GEZN01003538.1/:351-2072(-)